MSFYVEYELRCDCGGEKDPYGCDPAIYASTKARALKDARDEGWRTVAGKHYKPGHGPVKS